MFAKNVNKIIFMAAPSSSSIDSLHAAFARLKLSDETYPLGRVASPALGTIPLRVDDQIMVSPNGRVLSLFANRLIERKWLHLPTSLVRFFNSNLKMGTCFGESLVFILYQRPDTEINPWPIAARAEAIVFQLFQDIYYDVSYQLHLETTRIHKKNAQALGALTLISNQMNKLEREQSDLQVKIKPSMKGDHVKIAATYWKNARALSGLKKKHKTLEVQIDRCTKQLEHIKQKRLSILPQCAVWQHVVANALTRQHLHTLEVVEVRAEEETIQFSSTLKETLTKKALEPKTLDLMLTVESIRDTVDHVIVIQPKTLRLYDSNAGVICYPDFSALLNDFLAYVKREAISAVTIEVIGPES